MGSGTQVRSRSPVSASDRYHLFMVCNTTASISINLLLDMKNFNLKVFEVIILEWSRPLKQFLYYFLLGPDCGEDYDECKEESPCANGATCLNYQGGYNCTCTEGYKGRNCTEVDCDSVSCQNGGQCRTRPPPHNNKWMCQCPQYVHGKTNLCKFSYCLCHRQSMTFESSLIKQSYQEQVQEQILE